MILLRNLMLLLLLVLLAGCSSLRPNWISMSDPSDEDGIGGTGKTETIIVGEITGFGSIFVNGVKIEYNKYANLYLNEKSVTRYTFHKGDVVEVRARERGNAVWAHKLNVRHEVIGKVDKVSSKKRVFVVLGQTVKLKNKKLSVPEKGKMVRVSGFRDSSGKILATYVSLSPDKEYMLRGQVTKQGNSDHYYIGKQKLKLPAQSGVKTDDYIKVLGKLDNVTLQASSWSRDEIHVSENFARKVIVQGRMKKLKMGKYRIGAMIFDGGGKVNSIFKKSKNKIVRFRIVKPWSNKGRRLEILKPDQLRLDLNKGPKHSRSNRAQNDWGKEPKINGLNNNRRKKPQNIIGRPNAANIPGPIRQMLGLDDRQVRQQAEIQKFEKPVKPGKREKPEKPEKFEKPEKPEKRERPEKPEKFEKPERPEIDEHEKDNDRPEIIKADVDAREGVTRGRESRGSKD